MTTMTAEVYDALREAGAGEAASRRAAEALAGHEDRFHGLERTLDGLDRKIEGVEAFLAKQIGAVESTLNRRMDGLEHKGEAAEARLRAEQVLIRWLFGTVLTILIAISLKIFLY